MAHHIPVLLNETLEILDPHPGERALDCTLGGGGDSEKLLQAIGPTGKFLGVDADELAVKEFKEKFGHLANVQVVVGNFQQIKEIAKAYDFPQADLILFDFGLSSDQLDNPERGFSFQADGPLDMRLSREGQVTAAYLLNHASEEELHAIIRDYGEEFNARRIAKAVVRQRRNQAYATTAELFDTIKHALPGPLRFKAGDVARRTFQALRIAVNRELDSISEGLRSAWGLLAPGGRMAAISFHSLEDRIVKQYFAELSRGCVCPPDFPVCTCGREAQAIQLTRKPITATEAEIKTNPRSKPAKLRAIKRSN